MLYNRATQCLDHHLLHRIDPNAGIMVFVPTSRAALSRMSFADGRTPFASGPARVLPIAAAFDAPPPMPDTPRYILHMGFSGSTLLATLLDLPGTAFVLKEPNALADLANWHAHCAERGIDDVRMPMVGNFAAAMLHRRWSPDEAVVVKPSNWTNNIADELAANARVVIATIEPRAFVTAIFRGGRERMLFASRALIHLASAKPVFQRLFADATVDGGPFDKVARIAALLHAVQLDLLAGIPAATRINFARICEAPEDAVAEACTALALPAPDARCAEHRALTTQLNAKQPGLQYSREVHARADNAVNAQHGATIAAAIDWVATRLAQFQSDGVAQRGDHAA